MKNFILIIVAIILIIPFGTLGFLYSLVVSRDHSKYFRGMAESLDQFGNVICQDIFNLWLLKAGGYEFGNIDETVSSVLGKNKLTNTLSRAGRKLEGFLNKMDDNHSIDAIELKP
jgi:8-oxo-dGTP diphosphatase